MPAFSIHRLAYLLAFLITPLFVACSGNTTANAQLATHKKADPNYVESGFYFISANNAGILMKKDFTNETYLLARTPFASVRHMKSAEIKTTQLDGRPYPELEITFDIQG